MFKSNTTSLNHKRKFQSQTMEEQDVVSLILRGCKLAKDLESNLQNLANQSDTLANYCDEIAKIFGGVKERLRGHDMLDHHQHQPLSNIEPASLQEWLRSGVRYTQAMDINSIHPQTLLSGGETKDLADHMRGSIENRNLGRIDFLGSSSSSGPLVPSSSSSQRSRRRYIHIWKLNID